MAEAFKSSQIINGTYGRVWFNNVKYANLKSLEAKVTPKYEDVDISDDPGQHRKFLGYECAGTAVFYKVDSRISKDVSEAFKRGEQPDFKAVVELADPAAMGYEQIELIEITFDEITLAKFENKKTGEVELPFKFATYNWLNAIA